MRFLGLILFLAGTLVQAEAFAGLKGQLTVLLQFEGEAPNASLSTLDTELKHILSASHVPIQLMLRTDPLDGVVVGDLVIFRMKGSCSMATDMPVAALSNELGPLAMTHIVNGEILPFADVECDRIRESVQRTARQGNVHFHETQFGMALARVMAHELYHMLAKSTNHQASGLSKKALSSQDLTTGVMLLSGAAQHAVASQTRTPGALSPKVPCQ